MYQFLETIKIQDGEPKNLETHQRRLDQTQKHHFRTFQTISLKDLVSQVLTKSTPGVFKFRCLYSDSLRSFESIPYSLKNIKRLKIVKVKDLDYSFKFADRKNLDYLYSLRSDCDDVLIVRSELITDCTYANVAFYDGKNWYTPNTPLLNGTKRQLLLIDQKIQEREIKINDLQKYIKIRIFNALIEFEDKMEISVSEVY